MSRWLALVKDGNVGGTTLDKLVEPTTTKIPKPTLWVPVTTAQINDNANPLNRDNEIRGRRGNVAPQSFAARPEITIEGRAYPKIVNQLIIAALSSKVSVAGTGPAALTTTYKPIPSGNLLPNVLWLLREGQLDRLTGCIVSELELNFAVDAEATFKAVLNGLFHDIDEQNYEADGKPKDEYKDPGGTAGEAWAESEVKYEGYDYAFMLRDAIAKTKTTKATPTEAELATMTEFKFTINNGMIVDAASIYSPGHNILKAEIDEKKHKLWFPARHKIGAQNITGTMGFSDVNAVRDLTRLLSHAEGLTFKCVAGPLATTPPAEETVEFAFGSQVLSGTGAEPIVREGDQRSTYEFSAYLDTATGSKDLEVAMVAKEEVKQV